jgi:hypothetical protein
LRSSFLFARERQTPLNIFLTVDYPSVRGAWKKGDKSAENVSKVHEKILKSISDFLANHKIPKAWEYVIENPPKGGPGPHLHLLLHLPPDRAAELKPKIERVLRISMGWKAEEIEERKHLRSVAKQAAQIEIDAAKPRDQFTIGKEAKDRTQADPSVRLPFKISDHTSHGDVLTDDEAEKCLAYMCKTIDPDIQITLGGELASIADHASRWDITLQEGGDVRVKRRAGASVNLQEKAREEAGFVAPPIGNLEWMSRRVYLERNIEKIKAGLKLLRQNQIAAEPQSQVEVKPVARAEKIDTSWIDSLWPEFLEARTPKEGENPLSYIYGDREQEFLEFALEKLSELP